MVGKVQKEFSRKELSDYLVKLSEQIRDGKIASGKKVWSVPEAIVAFLDSTDFEDAIRNAVSLGGDADTQAAIAGAIAESYYKGIPPYMLEKAWSKIPQAFRSVITDFSDKYGTPEVPKKG